MAGRNAENTPLQCLQLILENFKAQNEALKGLLSTIENSNNLITPINHNIILEKFDPTKEEFSSYLERFENFLDMSGIFSNENPTEEQKKQFEYSKTMLLIDFLDPREFLELKATFKKDKVSTVPYNDLINELKKRYDRSSNLTTERCKFAKREQNKSESIADYVAALKLLNQRCEWPNQPEEMNDAVFQTLFIAGLSDQSIREKLLEQKHLKLEDAIETALALESAREENTEESESNLSSSFSANNKESTFETKES